MPNTIQKLYEQGQSIWCDNISRQMIDSGELQRLIDLGVTGVTSNPTIFMKAVTQSADYDGRLSSLADQGHGISGLYEHLVLPDIADAADLLRPIYDRTNGVDGYVSLEVSPRLAYDTEATVAEGRRLFAALDRPNILIKVPGTEEGLPAIEALIANGINVNVTLIFDVAPYERVMQAYLKGLERFDQAGGAVARVASVASFFVSRIDTAVDRELDVRRAAGTDVAGLPGEAAIAIARTAYTRFEQFFDPGGPFGRLLAKGAHIQRVLWASTSTKNPNYPRTKYIDGLVAPNSVNTVPPATMEAMLAEGRSEITIHDHLEQSRRVLDRLAVLGIDTESVTDTLLSDGVTLFTRSFDELLANIERKKARLNAAC